MTQTYDHAIFLCDLHELFRDRALVFIRDFSHFREIAFRLFIEIDEGEDAGIALPFHIFRHLFKDQQMIVQSIAFIQEDRIIAPYDIIDPDFL